MTETRSGTFRRKAKAKFIEIEARRSDTYEEFARRAALALYITVPPNSGKLTLFKASNGAAILCKDVNIKGKTKHWTLGNYLLLLKKSASCTKIGCGVMFEDDSVSSSGDESHCEVRWSGYNYLWHI